MAQKVLKQMVRLRLLGEIGGRMGVLTWQMLICTEIAIGSRAESEVRARAVTFFQNFWTFWVHWAHARGFVWRVNGFWAEEIVIRFIF